MARRAPGEGGITQRANGTWCGQLYVTVSDGSRQRRWVYGKTRREAAQKLAALRRADERGLTRAVVKQTVGEYLTWWVDVELAARVAEGRMAETTRRNYRSKVVRHLLPHAIAKVQLQQLTAQHVRTLMRNKHAERGFSMRSVQYLHGILRSALADAVELELLAVNVATIVRVPSPPPRRPPALAPETARTLVAALAGDRLEALYLVGIATGMRPGEVLGLEWRDLDLRAGEVLIHANLVRVPGAWRLHDTKTHRHRTVALPRFAIEALRRHRAAQAAERLAAGPLWRPAVVLDGPDEREANLVFRRLDGAPIRQDELEDHLTELCEHASVPRLTPHKLLRHGGATLMLAQGASLATIREILGHSTVKVTEMYAHVLDDAKREVADRLDDLLGGPNDSGVAYHHYHQTYHQAGDTERESASLNVQRSRSRGPALRSERSRRDSNSRGVAPYGHSKTAP